MEYNAPNLEHAVSQFYHTDTNMQAQAHQWLTAARSSPNAWAFVWELLQPNKVSYRHRLNVINLVTVILTMPLFIRTVFLVTVPLSIRNNILLLIFLYVTVLNITTF